MSVPDSNMGKSELSVDSYNQLKMNLALTTQIFETQERINKVQRFIEQHRISPNMRKYAILQVKACIINYDGKGAK